MRAGLVWRLRAKQESTQRPAEVGYIRTDSAPEDARQAREAIAVLRHAELIAVTVPALREFVWVLRRVYRHRPSEIGRAIRCLCSSAAVVRDRPSVEAGLAWLEAGGDTFVGLDKNALQLGGVWEWRRGCRQRSWRE